VETQMPRADTDLSLIVRAQGRQIEQLQIQLQQLTKLLEEQSRVLASASAKSNPK